ncbi:HAMP domain-containing sensor histidine kinase [Bacillus sp. DX1.1]|uniref:sensor histidine kinase n=1 Tax=unclassified Bacillus (in: firmicutes) TaxID=185979 RepID=UPI0025707495|nr:MULTISPECIES: HAMP domain-containing sensor histidine kinase [unclassified Bacillus (in: firmicutes)]MDM5157189.1 HAMP domain-containing sensor histidine kinase [Bacillus sp. DX1.1]WJE81420.1 HAMP domain-containing sensor histidine kinase [Bacillus sp. DX3.1]
MRIKTRFTFHLALGLVFWMLATGFGIVIIIEGILPLFDIIFSTNDEGLLSAWIFGISTIICIGLFGWYFGGPIGFIMAWIHQLSQENYEQPVDLQKIYTKKGKLRMRYLLYQEVLQHLQLLAVKLQAAEIEREKIENAKQEWIAGISHDLKTPLTYIKGYSTLLLNDEYEWSKEEVHSFIQEIDDKGKHMEELIQDLSLVLRLNNTNGALPLNKKNQDLVEFTKRVVASISHNPQASNYKLHFKTDTPVINVEFDHKFMQRILQNILMNSILHNPEHTDIYTRLSDKGENVVIHIMDNGVGISTHMIENLFQQYYRGTTTDSSSDGTGLGMAIVHKLVHAHDGTISVESELSKGTSFNIILPKKGRS